MSSRLTNRVRTRFKALRSRFPYLGTDFLKILFAIACGIGLASLFTWVASTAAIGIYQTVALTVVHIPLEIVAWALTIQGPRLFWPTLLGKIRGEHTWRHVSQKMREVLITAAIFYFLAALAEWAEHALLER